MRFLILVGLLAVSWVSGETDVKSSGVALEDMLTDVPNLPNPKPLVVAKPTQPMRVNGPPMLEMTETKTETKVESPALNAMQVTGFITASGSIYEVEDKHGMGQIEARQNGELLTPQTNEYICNYGSVVLYSDQPCEQVVETQKPVATDNKEHKETLDKPMEVMNKDKDTSALDVQFDENSDSVDHKQNDGILGETVAHAPNSKKSKKPSRKNGNKKNNKQPNRQNNNNRIYVVRRRKYKVPKPQGQQIVQQQQQQQQQEQVLEEQTVVQVQNQRRRQQQKQQQGQTQQKKQSQRRQQSNNPRRRQQQQMRRMQQLRQQQRRRLQQQNAANLAVETKQRFISADGLVYEIIHEN